MFLVANDYHLPNIGVDEAKFLIEFIYTDELDEERLERMIESVRHRCEHELGVEPPSSKKPLTNLSSYEKDDENCLDYKSPRVKWMLVVNELIRGCIRFGLTRLEKLLVHYLLDKFLTIDTVLFVLMDALDQDRSGGVLSLVEDVCLSFTKMHVKEIIKLDEFKLLPKQVLLKIVLNL